MKNKKYLHFNIFTPRSLQQLLLFDSWTELIVVVGHLKLRTIATWNVE